MDLAADMIDSDPKAARALLGTIKEQTQGAVGEIRRLVHDLRPASLDELGLAGALRGIAAQHNHDGLRLCIETPDELPVLPAAVEVACYRILQEALTNVTRHAGASRCEVRLVLDEGSQTLSLEVDDDGEGIAAEHRFGVGLNSMRQRAEELGGTLTVRSSPRRGTRVCALLPVRRP